VDTSKVLGGYLEGSGWIPRRSIIAMRHTRHAQWCGDRSVVINVNYFSLSQYPNNIHSESVTWAMVSKYK